MTTKTRTVRFYQRHYDALARVLAQFEGRPVQNEIVMALAGAFVMDNPRFDPAKWIAACHPAWRSS